MLEVFTALIMIADFSKQGDIKNQENEGRINPQVDQQAAIKTSGERLQAKNDMIEHKINLLVLLFSFREQ
jgi:hypothetical protein